MVQGTTPTYTLEIDDYDLTESSVFVTIKSGCQIVTKTGSDLTIEFDGEMSTVMFSLTQEETIKFEVGNAKVQVRFINADGEAFATEDGQFKVKGVLLKEVIHYGG